MPAAKAYFPFQKRTHDDDPMVRPPRDPKTEFVMKNAIMVAALALGTLVASNVAYADQGIVNPGPQTVVSQTASGVVGQSYPNFNGPQATVSSGHLVASTGG